MESYRLKNIVIIILLILNLFLASLLLNFRLQGTRARQEMMEQLNALFTSNAISLSDDLDLNAAPLTSLSVHRNLEEESAIAAMLLGEAVTAEHQGGGIYSYAGSYGTVHFRSNGNFDYTPVNQRINDPADFCETFCETYGYVPTDPLSSSTDSFTATQYLGEHAIYNATVTFQFNNGYLIALSGSYISSSNTTPVAASSSLSTVDALVQLLDYRNETGVVCNSIQEILPVYELQSGPSASLQLTAKWQITADAYQYYVDCSTGAVIRA